VVIGGIASDWFTRFLLEATPAAGRSIESSVDESTTTLDELLAAGHLDVAMVGVHGYGDEDAPPGCHQLTVVESQPYLVALGHRHPLASRTEIDLAELGGTPWLLPRGRPDGTMPAFLDACRRAGFQPDAPVGPADLTFFSSWLVEEGAACLCSPAYLPHPGVVPVPLRGGVDSQIRIRWNPDRITDAEIDRLRVQLATAYVAQVRLASGATTWWRDVPDFRPVLAADLVDRVPPLDDGHR
jgi:hypothetical protein